MNVEESDLRYMARAVELAARGRGAVEPNPMVGCVIIGRTDMEDQPGRVMAEDWHRHYGGPHAEILALNKAGARAEGGTMYVSLEPCCHHGKTPPCTNAIVQSGIRRIVVAHQDPYPDVAGQGIRQLKDAGLPVEMGLLEKDARGLNAPYGKLIETKRPWIIAKWAMTLDGKLATRTGHSRWISNQESRQLVHQLRGRVDGILVGRGTVEADDPRLTSCSSPLRVATRIVVDSRARISSDSQLVRTARDVPVIVAVSPDSESADRHRLEASGCEVLVCPGQSPTQRLGYLLGQLGQRRMTNVLVEGGSRLLGSLWDANEIDEVHVFIGPKLVGGENAPSPIAGEGRGQMPDLSSLENVSVEQRSTDIYVHGRVASRAEGPDVGTEHSVRHRAGQVETGGRQRTTSH